MGLRGVWLQDWKQHLIAQLDSLLGRMVQGSLLVLRGDHNRLEGGTLSSHAACEIAAFARCSFSCTQVMIWDLY
jgi:hypothetical protein